MKLHKDCITCLGRIGHQVARNACKDRHAKREVVRLGEAVLREAFRPDKCPPWLASRALEEISAVTGESDPYHSVRQKEMAAAQKIYRRISSLFGGDFTSCVELAVLGNNLDFFRDTRDLEAVLIEEHGRRPNFYIDHIERAQSVLNSLKNGSVLFLADNAGEVFFDIPLMENINSLGAKVVYGVKDKPFLNDLTWADLEEFGILSQIPRVMSTGTAAILDLQSLSEAFRQELETCDLIISKGQANYECLSELPIKRNIFYLLKAKCQPISRALNVPLNSHVALLAETSVKENSTRQDEAGDRPV